jgi:hypothetical protein
MASKYYILNLYQYEEHSNTLEYTPAWNVAHTQCIIEVDSSYYVPNFFSVFGNANECQDYIYHPDRIDEWYQPDESELL